MAASSKAPLPWNLGIWRQQLYASLLVLAAFSLAIVSARAENNYNKGKRIFQNKSIERTLIQTLLDNYQQYGIVGRPVKRSDVQMSMQYGLALVQILDLDENKQILRTNCWSRYKWHDDLLRWDPEDFGNVRQIRVFPDQLWTPDIKLYNYADERMKFHRIARVLVYKDGTVTWVPQALFKSTCPVTIMHFPFDRQQCELEFGSWAYDISQLDIDFWVPDTGPSSPSPYIDLTTYTRSPEWFVDGEVESDLDHTKRKIQAMSKKRIRVISMEMPNGSTIKRKHRTIRYILRMNRNPTFYIAILIIPCVLLSTLTLVLFWIPPESPTKTMLGLNIFVAFFILLLLLAGVTPTAVKDFPLIGTFFCLNMVMITLSTFIAVTIVNLYVRGDKKGPVPMILRQIVIEGMGRLLIVRQNMPLMDEDKLKKLLQTASPSPCHHGKSRMIQNMRYNKFLNEDPTFPRPGGDLSLEDSPLLGGYVMSTLEWEVHEIKKFIRAFATKHREGQKSNLVAMEWRCLSLVIDRLFFCIYLFSLSVSCIILIPRHPSDAIPKGNAMPPQ